MNNISNVNELLTYHYKFIFRDGTIKEFKVNLDNKTLNLIPTGKKSNPAWAALKDFKCLNCSLEEEQYQFCPVAVNLVDLLDFFKGSMSHEKVNVVIETDARNYMKYTTLQKGISSLIGIYMVTSGCPIMEKLKPMVRHHLPFATIEETMYRVLSMYLLAQYFLYKRGREPDWDLKKLVKIYEDIRIVNRNFCKKLQEVKFEDASINALVILDCFADSVAFSISENLLNEIESLFKAYF